MRALLLVIAVAGCSSIDHDIEAARKSVLALDSTHAQSITTWCKSLHQPGALDPRTYPSALPAAPTTISARDGAIDFEWWNNSHAEEDDAHPGFVLTCSDRAIDGAKQLATGLWYRDTPMNSGG